MKNKQFPILLLVVILSHATSSALATHDTGEKYDGTIYSFRWLKDPIDVSGVPLLDETGKESQLSQFTGKIVLLNLWASWCAPCVKELPTLDELQKDLGDDDFIVVPISIDQDPKKAKAMYNKLSIKSMPLLRNSAEIMARYFPIDVLPVNIMINRHGQAIGLLRSTLDWQSRDSKRLIQRLIEGVNVDTLRSEKSF